MNRHDNSARADELAARAQSAWDEGRRFAAEAHDAIDEGARSARHDAAEAFGRARSQVGDAARRGWDSAREFGADVRHRVDVAGERTTATIKEQPLKSVLVAAAAGAVVALLIGALASQGRTRR
ncbi:hypothetical protein [Rubrivivax gelatinosus]|uniref:ElaB/YqjD/DUF883 family membrane-anchored ribosome-binding protein n=1 Tax=Rubrivivax gelatinosus (strain NBRC 100245 / IL144) TaxID=983917 RepID=I0HT61_RUBGI|nr:hypothetical protein [Rubrivivax gelatinosus]MBG6082746.1 ElaB/YqjD/DUF883 family membrane-anchored ribosome-binding protein [Rubrivivax gelatinosus]BAL96198.1 hypothetical protein RGE_28590 [Rubrivivax gelatinosus IL144]